MMTNPLNQRMAALMAGRRGVPGRGRESARTPQAHRGEVQEFQRANSAVFLREDADLTLLQISAARH